ncbi:MAG: hypothetical protein R3A12_09840 [Ignavibacteria bacterium]
MATSEIRSAIVPEEVRNALNSLLKCISLGRFRTSNKVATGITRLYGLFLKTSSR